MHEYIQEHSRNRNKKQSRSPEDVEEQREYFRDYYFKNIKPKRERAKAKKLDERKRQQERFLALGEAEEDAADDSDEYEYDEVGKGKPRTSDEDSDGEDSQQSEGKAMSATRSELQSTLHAEFLCKLTSHNLTSQWFA